ncbi:phenylalanine 4-monooxygenase [Aquisediminimonas profunda]|uniref:phenylalanine 4-monooxygenase n=1 Tax=Aquisediminimonas profunda TaxID=1550733 RepID=UPI001C62E61B|nr:phenylalanine 4-monooxygenase [Aquisediminimonas profunda]
MDALHVYETPPPDVAEDWTMPQDWQQFTKEEHARWHEMVVQQTKSLQGLASDSFLQGVRAVGLDRGGIPEFGAFNEKFRDATGWEVVAVPGVIPNEPFFKLLAERRFPVANFLRKGGSQDYNEEPDMFHDVYGHLPMFVDPTFGEFMAAYGRAGLRSQKLGTTDWLGRLYLHTVEFGLIREGNELRAYGAGLLSSYAESVHALTSEKARRLHFNLPRLMRTLWPFDTFQPTYFVIESFEALLEEMETTSLKQVYNVVRELPLIPVGETDPSDRVYAKPSS